MSQNNAANRGPLDVLEFPMASLFTPAPGSDRDRASLNWSILNGNPRISVWTRVQGEKSPIQGGIGGPAMQALLDDMEDCYLGNGRKKRKFDVMTRPKTEDGSTTGEYRKVLACTVKYGIDEEDGLCWIMVESADDSRAKIVFKYRGFEWHPMATDEGALSEPAASRVHALASVRYLRQIFIQHSKGQTQEERKARAEQFKARKNGGQSGGQRSSYQAKPADAMGNFSFGGDEDVGF